MWRGTLRREDSPPKSPGGLRDPNQHCEPLHAAPRRIRTRTERHTDPKCFGATCALQKWPGDVLPHGRDEAVRWLPGRDDTRRTVCFYCSQRGRNATEWPEQSSLVTCCTAGHLRLRVEAVVGHQLEDWNPFVHFVNAFRTYLRGMFTHNDVCPCGH